jgi:hypothetical protein
MLLSEAEVINIRAKTLGTTALTQEVGIYKIYQIKNRKMLASCDIICYIYFHVYKGKNRIIV